MRHRRPEQWGQWNEAGAGSPEGPAPRSDVSPGWSPLDGPRPGSIEAERRGCRCPVLGNQVDEAEPVIAPDCPVHPHG